MTFIETDIAGAFLVALTRHEDLRGSFARVWSTTILQNQGLCARFVECNSSRSRKQGTIRGLHYQCPPHEEAKLVQCTSGAVFDVLVDLRPDSPTRHRWAGFDLRAGSDQLLYVPPGCAHGLQTLQDDSEILYWVSSHHMPEAERGLLWSDPFFGIQWPYLESPIVSQKDSSWPPFVGATPEALGS